MAHQRECVVVVVAAVVVVVVVVGGGGGGGEGGRGASSPLITEKVTMGLSNMRHKGRVRTQSISDIMFVIFVIIFGELSKGRNLRRG